MFGVMLVGFGWMLYWQLQPLTNGYSANELQTMRASSSLTYIFHHPINAPFTLLAHALLLLDNHLLMLRLTSVIFGLTTISIFFWLVRHWHDERSAFLGTLVFGTSAWFVHGARLGTPDVLLLLLLALVACGTWLKQRPRAVPLFACFILAAGLAYVPGMIWFIAAGVVWRWKTIDKIFNKQLWMVSLGALLLLVTLAPLGWAIYKTPHIAKELVGLPLNGWPQVLPTIRSIVEVPVYIFLRGPFAPEHWVGRVPLLDAFSVAMCCIGAYLYARHFKLARAKATLTILAIGTILSGLGGAVSLTLLVPFLYLLVATGIGFMLDRWWVVFPRNVIAQGIGLGLVGLAVLVSCWYSLTAYFVVWPNTPTTKAIFVVSSDTIKK